MEGVSLAQFVGESCGCTTHHLGSSYFQLIWVPIFFLMKKRLVLRGRWISFGK
uniref:Uncharacterized protein n=1 Tax=Arundo donax TaxID=35708 RepID=A0A0A9ACR3_ARUDO